MSIHTFRHFHKWKVVKGNFLKDLCICTRCNNNVNYILCFDSDTLWHVLKYNKVYAYKCPVCPNFEEISAELAKAIIEESR